MRTAIWLATAAAVLSSMQAFAGAEMPMYQFPQAKQMPMLPDPATKPGHARNVSCTPVQNPQTTSVDAGTSDEQQKYHVVDGKCVVDEKK